MSRLVRVLGLRAGEGPVVALTMSISFLASAGMMIAQSSADALFFARYGADRLPVMYLLLGGAMFAISSGLAFALARLGRSRAFVLILMTIGAVAVVGRAAIETEQQWVYGALWLAYSIAEFGQMVAVWGLAGLVADTRQAKRFFPLIGAGGVAGLILGGTATAPLAAMLGSENLLVVWALLSAGAAALAWRLVRTGIAAPAPPPARNRRSENPLTAAARDVRRSQLLRWMAVGALLLSFMFYMLYLPFSAAAAERYPDPDDLAGFFGLFFAVAMGTGLLLSLLVTGRLLARFGVPVVVLVLPLLYVIAFGVLTVAAAFATLTLFRFTQVGWVSGGASSTWEALVNAIPADHRDRVRSFIYGVPKQLGTITAGGVALAAQALDSERTLYVAGLSAGVVAVAAISRVRAAYPRELVIALREGRPTIFGASVPTQPRLLQADATAVSLLAGLLGEGDDASRRLAARALGDLDVPSSPPLLEKATSDADEEVRAIALESLERLEPETAVRAARARLADEAARVRLTALRVIARSGDRPPAELLRDEDPEVRALAAATLIGHDSEAERTLRDAARSPDASTRAAAMHAVAATHARSADDVIRASLGDPAPSVRAGALRALASTPGGVDDAVTALGDPDARVRDAAADVLAAGGGADDGAADAIRRFAATAVARAVEDDRRARAVAAGDGAAALLRDSLRARAERHAVDALRAAALLGDRAVVATAIENLAVSDPAQRANALEVIETVADPDLVRPLLRLWEPDRGSGGADVLAELRNDPDEWIRTCTDAALAQMEGETMTETLPTLPLIERVIFLRNVPLFAPLPPQDLQPLAEIAEEHVFSEGETIAARGEPGDTLYVIVEGEVEVVDDGQLIARRRPGDVIGEMAVISSRPRMASLVATSGVRLLEIHKPAFEAILRERPETALAMMRVLCERVAPAE